MLINKKQQNPISDLGFDLTRGYPDNNFTNLEVEQEWKETIQILRDNGEI